MHICAENGRNVHECAIMHTPSAGPTYLALSSGRQESYKIKKQTFKNKNIMNYKVIERKDRATRKHRASITVSSSTSPKSESRRLPHASAVPVPSRGTTVWPFCRPCRNKSSMPLQEGKRVHLGDIGSFRTVANGLGSDTAEKYDPAYITKLRVCFTPNTKLKKPCRSTTRLFTLERVDFLPEEEDSEEEGDI